MKPLPTGVYNLLDRETDPLLSVDVTNESREPKRICVRAYIEGLSTEEVHTVEIDRGKQTAFKLLPTLLPERAQRITEVQRATLHVLAEDLDGKTEIHETHSIVTLHALEPGLRRAAHEAQDRVPDRQVRRAVATVLVDPLQPDQWSPG